MRIRLTTLIGAAALAAGIAVLFLNPAEQYFMGDSIAVLIGRPLNWGFAVHDLWRLGGTHWYRPLSNAWPALLLWPHWGLNFAPYHRLAIALHWAASVGLFLGLRWRVRDEAAAWIGAALFAFHPIQFYTTYDLAFYQEPMGVGFVLASLACLLHFAGSGKGLALGGGLFCFALALASRENSVAMPAVLALLLLPPQNWRRAAIAWGSAAAMGTSFFVWHSWHLHPLLHQPESYWPDRSPTNWLRNGWHALRWSFGIPASDVTSGWQSPTAIRVVLAISLLAACLGAAVLFRRFPDALRGLAWFGAAGAAAFSTHHLKPHHIYLAMTGTALLVATLVAALRQNGRLARLAAPIAAALLTALFSTALIGARFDSLDSWLGWSSWSTRDPAANGRSLVRSLAHARGIWVTMDAGDDQAFAWAAGNVFRELAGEQLEVRLMHDRPASAPEGFLVFDYRNHVFRPLAVPTSHGLTPRAWMSVFSPRGWWEARATAFAFPNCQENGST